MSTTSGSLSILFAGSELLTATEYPGANESQRTMKTGGKGIDRAALTSVSSPKVDKPIAAFLLTLTNGAPTTIDLTAVQGLTLPIGSTRNIDLSGAKITAALFETDSANTGVVTVEQGASNPYLPFGSGNKIDMPKGLVAAIAFKGVASQLAAVAAGAKTLKFSTTVTGDKIYVEIWAGT